MHSSQSVPLAPSGWAISYRHPDAIELLADRLREVAGLGRGPSPTILCIGSDSTTGDSLGPMVGTLVQEMGVEGITVIGTLDQPVHALTLPEVLRGLPPGKVLAIDAFAGRLDEVGTIRLRPGPIAPGCIMGHGLPLVGDYALYGVVASRADHPLLSYALLATARLGLVWGMARVMALAIVVALRRGWPA